MSKRRRKKKGNGLLIAVIVIIAGIAIGVGGFSVVMGDADKALDPDSSAMMTVEIPSGSTTTRIGTILVEQGIIDSADSFKLQSKMKGMDGKYKAGEYTLSPAMTMTEIMDILVSGNVNTVRFTIPEGLMVSEVADKLSAEGLINRELFMKEIESGEFNYRFLKDAPSGELRLEGYLYPNTYDVFTTASEHDIIDRLLRQLDTVFTDEMYARADELGMDLNEVMTIASLFERETMVDSERAKVASVIYNRLDIGMKLQIDATVQYALGESKQFLTYKDLEVDSPYNTYQIDGLPPGPICSPGEASIKAALYPEDTDYIYYVLSAAKDGSHKFAKTGSEFLKYKQEYKTAYGLQ
ncbi:MAG: endolytic transglycosylase MltG [Firmicutes bacterium]|nr:endolytic transglycosylase MltG [Bacillota bacterium]